MCFQSTFMEWSEAFWRYSSLDRTHAGFSTAVWNHNILENSHVALKLGKDSLLTLSKTDGISSYPGLGSRVLFLPWGSALHGAKKLGSFESFLICCASLSKRNTNSLNLLLLIREQQPDQLCDLSGNWRMLMEHLLYSFHCVMCFWEYRNKLSEVSEPAALPPSPSPGRIFH